MIGTIAICNIIDTIKKSITDVQVTKTERTNPGTVPGEMAKTGIVKHIKTFICVFIKKINIKSMGIEIIMHLSVHELIKPVFESLHDETGLAALLGGGQSSHN